MKTAKKILAVLLVVMMLTLMIPFAASAAESYSYEIQNVPEGYTVTVYKVADIDPTTMLYSNFASEAIETQVISASSINSKDVLAACDALTSAQLGSLIKYTETSKSNVPAGIYYAKVTGVPSGVNVTKAESSVFALPYYEGSTRKTSISFSVGNKINDEQPKVTKYFANLEQSVTSITEFIGVDIYYTLEGTVVGQYTPAALQATKYEFVDTMSEGLDYVDGSVTVEGDLVGEIDAANYTVSYANHVLTVALKPAYLATEDFYDNTSIYVNYTAKLNANAVKGVQSLTTGDTDDNYNTVELNYEAAGQPSTLTGPYLEVYTFDIDVVKVDGNDNTNKLDGAKFTVYTNEACTTVATNGAEKTTANGGKATFEGFKAGKYYVKETAAPSGYNLNSTVYTVVISADGTVTVNGTQSAQVIVPDYPLFTPQTGGTGTMIFSIVGLSLIACAGILFLVVRKRRSTK